MLRSELIEWLIDCIDLITFPPVSDIKMKRRNDIESFFIKKKKESESATASTSTSADAHTSQQPRDSVDEQSTTPIQDGRLCMESLN